MFFKTVSIKPTMLGFLFRDNRYVETLQPGVYQYFAPFAEITAYQLPTTAKLLFVNGQEILAKDNIALRFSYSVEYRISDGVKFLHAFDLSRDVGGVIYEAESHLHNVSQIVIRNIIGSYQSTELHEQRGQLFASVTSEVQALIAEKGIQVERILLKDINFPKSIQDLFAKPLEAKIRSQADLENARTAVATARALKNASELMKDDDNLKYFQLLETLTKIAAKGSHTFMIGDFHQPSGGNKKS